MHVSTCARPGNYFEIQEGVLAKQLKKQLRENLSLLKGLLEAKGK